MPTKPPCVVVGVDGGIPTVVDRYVQEGALPHIARLMQEGAFADACLPAMPTITPTCWATIATGATPAVHGCTCASIHEPGTALEETLSAYWSERVNAEFVWEAAERAGRRALVVAYPTSWPPRLKQGFQIGGPGCGVVEYHTADTSPGKFIIDGVELQLFTTDECSYDAATQVTLGEGPTGQLEAELPAKIEHSAWRVAPFGWCAQFDGESRVRILDAQSRAEIVRLLPGQFSPDLEVALMADGSPRKVTYRMKLLYASKSQRRLGLFVTPMADLTERASPDGLGAELNALAGVAPFWHHGKLMQRKIIDHGTFLEIERASFDWRLRAFRHIHERTPLDLVFQYSVMVDSINHLHRRIIEGYADVDEATRQESIALERGAYQVVDDFVGSLREMLGPQATIMVVSDHGSCGYTQAFRPIEALKKAGLMVMRQGPEGEQIDWAASRAVPLRSCHIYVNLEGRDPTGIVPPEQYERTVDEIIAALYDAAEPETGKRMVALALRREDARMVGLGGDGTGDVVFAVAGGIGSPGGGVHAGQIPTARSRAGTQCSLLMASGPGIRKGHRITRTVRQHDIAPTISQLLGVPRPRQAEGAAIHDMFE